MFVEHVGNSNQNDENDGTCQKAQHVIRVIKEEQDHLYWSRKASQPGIYHGGELHNICSPRTLSVFNIGGTFGLRLRWVRALRWIRAHIKIVIKQ